MQCCVIMSVYKGSKLEYVKEALNSIYNQTLKADIFIKIDGEIDIKIKKFLFSEKEKGNITFLDYRKENLGIAVSYNELIQEALNRGYEYIVRMDSDDIMMPYRIEYQYNFMQLNPEIDVVGGYIEEFGEGFNYTSLVKYPLTHKEILNFFSKRVPMANVTTFFRNSFFKKAGLYPISSPTNEDTLLWMNGFKNGCKFANLPEVLVKVRVSKDFFYRRTGIQKAFSDFKDRIKVIKTLNYGINSYFYAIGMFTINILPPNLKKLAYKFLR